MKLSNTCRVVLLFLGVASLSIQGCVRFNFETREECVGLPEALAFEEQTELKHKITVSRFVDPTGNTANDAHITAEEVNGIFDHATNVLRCGEGNENDDECKKFDDYRNDFACKVTLERKDSDTTIPTFTFPPPVQVDAAAELAAIQLDCARDGEICSERDLQAVWNADPIEGIKVVKNVSYCEGIREGDPQTGTLGPTWVGCGQLPGRSVAVERIYKPMEEILWPHEYGHTKGLHHTTTRSCALNDDPKGLMSPEIWTTNTKLNGQECFGFRGGQP